MPEPTKEGMNCVRIRLHNEDLPEGFFCESAVAIDTETMGLQMPRDRLCLVQLSTGDGDADIIQISQSQQSAPRLKRLLEDPAILKIFHFGRFDIAALKGRFGYNISPVYCTKIASRLARTFTEQHGLQALCRDLLGIELQKQLQSSDWGAIHLTEEQLQYAASDVIHLHAIRQSLDYILQREGRMKLAEKCFEFLPVRADIDLLGWSGKDIFAH
ncbi:MAG: ribonuclease H-like domain-containing protein [Rhodobacteraceae bacterium]|nr:ribonuclease H-like domain-containing protein [Paracoccaceae bacterium]MCY4195946.1 ribonuclease H-like domain-containing protein [Paracoccaceae bacterium]MCY4327987.1 ribonuclease H-like domain-containing protein [Paracoccaceae bacterium]